VASSVPVEHSDVLASHALHLKCFAEVSWRQAAVNLEGVPACTRAIGQLLRRWKSWQLALGS